MGMLKGSSLITQDTTRMALSTVPGPEPTLANGLGRGVSQDYNCLRDGIRKLGLILDKNKTELS